MRRTAVTSRARLLKTPRRKTPGPSRGA